MFCAGSVCVGGGGGSWPRGCFRDSLTISLNQCCLNCSVDLGRIGALSTWFSQPGSIRKSVVSNVRTCLWPLSISLNYLILGKESSYGMYSSGLAVPINLLTSSASSMIGWLLGCLQTDKSPRPSLCAQGWGRGLCKHQCSLTSSSYVSPSFSTTRLKIAVS